MPARIPVTVAKRLAKELDLRQVILLAWDGKLSHVVSYGATIEDCDQAAQGADNMKKAMGWPESLNTAPSRVKKLQAEVDRLKKELQSAAARSKKAR